MVSAAVLWAAVVVACAPGAGGGDKAGGPSEPVVLRMAVTASNLGYSPILEYFVQRVAEVSGDDLRIEVAYRWGNFAADAEVQALHDVADGDIDLAWVGTRVFDTLGVDSFRALQAPMLVDSYAVQDAVIKSDVPGHMLGGLDRLGVVGLAVLAASLPKVFAVDKPLLGPGDWRGITFQAYRSNVQAAAIEALGATPTDTLAGLEPGLADGTIQGFAKSLLAVQLNGTEPLAPYVTANVNLWPGTGVILANPGRLSRLSSEQRGWLHRAAQDAIGRSTSLVEDEDQIAHDVCGAGGRFANASEADLAALRRAFVPVYASLEQDPLTKEFIGRIEALKRSTVAGPPLAIPPGCSGPAPEPTPSDDPFAGTWHTGHLTESQIVRAYVGFGGSEDGGHGLFSELGSGAKHYIELTVRFEAGDYTLYDSGDGGAVRRQDTGSYRIEDGATFTLSAGGCSSLMRYDLRGDDLRLHMVKPWCDADTPTVVAAFPFTRS